MLDKDDYANVDSESNQARGDDYDNKSRMFVDSIGDNRDTSLLMEIFGHTRINLKALKSNSPEVLCDIISDLGVQNISGLLKQELIFTIMKKIVDNGGEIVDAGVLEVI